MAAGGRLGERQVGVGILLSNGPGYATSMKCPARWAAVGAGWAMGWLCIRRAVAQAVKREGAVQWARRPRGGESFARNEIDRSSAAVEFPAGRVACLSCA